MKPRSVKEKAREVTGLLRHRSLLVRWGAAAALGRARIRHVELVEQLGRERNEIVIGEICDSLAAIGSERSVPALRRIAEKAPSQLARRYALYALADILGSRSLRYLRRRRLADRSRRVRATIDYLLFENGDFAAFERVKAHPSSRDVVIRRLTVNSLKAHTPSRMRHEVLKALREALATETARGARGDIEEALRVLAAERRTRTATF